MIDNTFASPVNFRPIEHGFDLSLHSATKYLNGHTDLIAGAVIGSVGKVEAVRHRVNHLGGSLDTHACFLLHRGVKTLPLRMERHSANATRIGRRSSSSTRGVTDGPLSRTRVQRLPSPRRAVCSTASAAC